MNFRHCFDFYTLRVREKRSSAYNLIRKFGRSEHDMFLLVSDFLEGLQAFRDYENKKTLILKDQSIPDDTHNMVYGFLKSGSYGVASEAIHRQNKDSVPLTEDHANVFKFFFLFYLPQRTNAGALIIHKIGNHGMYSQLYELLNTYFRSIAPDSMLEIQPVHINLKSSNACTLKKIELVYFEKPSALETAASGSVSPKRKAAARLILDIGQRSDVLKQMLAAEDAKDIALDVAAPFIQLKNVGSYNVTVNAKVEMNGLNKTLRVNKNFEYNTASDVTEDLRYLHGQPTLDSLLQEAKASIEMLKKIGVI